ncbi:MAG: non-homologous end-joining DNA ligase [Caulobacter sp.]|nr:non-homologous end-joining DNA ligase [Caulobacter sp.]
MPALDMPKRRSRQGLDTNAFPTGFLEFQHPKLADKPPTGSGWIHEVKFDGYRMQVHVRRGRATLYTRNGNDWTERLPHMAIMAGELPDCVLDAELCALGPEGYSDFSALRRSLTPGKDHDLVLMCFDALFEGDTDLRPFTLGTRKTVLRKLLDVGEPAEDYIRYVEPVAGEGKGLLDAACQLNMEGVVSKRLDSLYQAGKGEAWVKAKCRPTETVVIGGWKAAGGVSLSRLLAGVREPDGGLRYVGSIGSGFGRERGLLAKLKTLETAKRPFDAGEPPRKESDIHWVRPELLAEVQIAEMTGGGKLRQPVFKGIREDLAP